MNGSSASLPASSQARPNKYRETFQREQQATASQIKPLIAHHAPVGPEAAPLWRITAAIDPNTLPLELMFVWVVRIEPRKTNNYLRFSRSIARKLRAAEQGGDLDVHRNGSGGGGSSSSTNNVRHSNGRQSDPAKRRRRRNNTGTNDEAGQDGDDESDADDDDDESEDESEDEEDESMRHLRLFQRSEDSSSLYALVCRVQDLPSYDRVVALLKTVDVTADGEEPEPFEVHVPRSPAPSRNRLPEWRQYWPVSVKYGKVINVLVKPTLSGASAPLSCSITPGVVDRCADAKMWNNTARRWAICNFRKCLRMAWKAQMLGEVPIGAHVTSTYPEGDAIVSGASEGQEAIEAGAWDTRISQRNPIKHSVTNVIRQVAEIRSERDWERLLELNVHNAHLLRDPHIDPNVQRQAIHKELAAAEAAAAAAAAEAGNGQVNGHVSGSSSPASSATSRMLNGQDYLLNNLTLFTTHEPCVSCCMALVHSRVRAVFFIEPSPRAGGCCGACLEESQRCAYAQDGGPYAVQEQAGLNHKFDVWRWVGNDAELLAAIDDVQHDEESIPVGQARLHVNGLDA